MFIELHRLNGGVISINPDKIEYFVPGPAGPESGAWLSVPDYNGWLKVTESYDYVKKLLSD